jgi:hypothetical protein
MNTTQNNQEMTIDKAIRIFDDLLFEFTIRSGGGPDCLLIRESEEAIRFLRALQKSLQDKENQQ